MKARSSTHSVSSSSTWAYVNMLDSGELPNNVTISNVGDIGIYARWMNIDEGNGNADDRYYIAPGTEKTIITESSEKPINRIGLLLYSGAVATSIIISRTIFEEA